MTHKVVITTPDTGRTTIAVATQADVNNTIHDFLRLNPDETSFVIDVTKVFDDLPES